jgi:hypothetical protein
LAHVNTSNGDSNGKLIRQQSLTARRSNSPCSTISQQFSTSASILHKKLTIFNNGRHAEILPTVFIDDGWCGKLYLNYVQKISTLANALNFIQQFSTPDGALNIQMEACPR